MGIFLRIVLFASLLMAGLLEATLVPYPLVFIILGICFLLKEDLPFFIVAFVTGIFLDSLLFHTIGATPLFIAAFFIALYLFERVFSIIDIRLYMIFVFIGAEVYRIYAGYSFIPFVTMISFIMLMTLGIIAVRLLPAYAKKTV